VAATRTVEPALRVGLVGYGLAGEVFHGRLVAACPDLQVVGAVTRDPARAQRLAADHAGARAVPDVDALLGGLGPLDLVVVATPNTGHAEQARAALGVGAAVVVDKPLAVTADQAQGVVDAAAAAGRPLSVFLNRRWDSDQLTLARLVADGTLGEVHRHESRFERWRPAPDPTKWREALTAEEGGGQLIDLGSHLVDQSVQLFGPVQRVYAEVAARRGGGDDEAFVALSHRGGVASHLSLGAVFGAPGPRRRVLGSAAAYVVDELDGQEEALRGGVRGDDPALGVEPRARWGALHRGDEVVPVPSQRGQWTAFYPAMAAAVRGARPVPVDPRDAVAGLRVVEAARRSAATGTVVELG
jgi:scyllo-inositol 2-dehydrogenase (NADP+)